MATVTDRKQARRLFIDLVKRRARPGTGSSFGLLRERTTRVKVPDLSGVLSGIPWAAVGAIAARSYMPERTTADLDIAFLPTDAAVVEQRLRKGGFLAKGRLTIGGTSWSTPDGFPLDVIELRQPWAADALREAQDNMQPPGIPVLPLHYLVLMKFQAGRVVDIADVTRILGQATAQQRQAVRKLFRRYEPDGLDDLESLIALGRLEFEPGGPDR